MLLRFTASRVFILVIIFEVGDGVLMVNIQQLAKGTPWKVVKLFRLAQRQLPCLDHTPGISTQIPGSDKTFVPGFSYFP